MMSRTGKFRRPCIYCDEYFYKSSSKSKVCDKCYRQKWRIGLAKRLLKSHDLTVYKKAKLKQFKEEGQVHENMLVCRLCGSKYGSDAKKDNGVCIHCCNKKTSESRQSLPLDSLYKHI